ncbi:MAG: hypothetical protein L6R43_12615, partial [Planctomycetes bacterium]|nr:hypothetical protein [Planctomycetota bacterium]
MTGSPPRRPAGRWTTAALAAAAALAAWELLDRPPAPDAPAPVDSPASLAARIEGGLAGVERLFLASERRAVAVAESVAPRVLEAVPRPTASREDRAALFEVLGRALGEEQDGISGAAVVDGAGHPLAWWGRIFLGPRAPPPGGRPSTRVIQTNVYKVLAAEIPLTGPGGETSAALRVYAPFHSNLPLHNRFLRRWDFEDEAEAALGLERVNVRYGERAEETEPPRDPLSGHAPLLGSLGDLHGRIEITLRPAAEREALARGERSRWRRGAAAILLAALLLGGLPLRRLPAGAPREAARAASVLLLRLALHLLGVPSGPRGGEILDPSAFSVTLAGGLLRTPLDALLTAAAGGAAALFLSRALPRPGAPLPAPARAAALLGAAGVAALGGAAWIGLSRLGACQSR